MSQYDARTFGGATKTQIQTNSKNWCLPGDTAPAHDQAARLASTEYPMADRVVGVYVYLARAKGEMRKGKAVIATVFVNYYLFYGEVCPTTSSH